MKMTLIRNILFCDAVWFDFIVNLWGFDASCNQVQIRLIILFLRPAANMNMSVQDHCFALKKEVFTPNHIFVFHLLVFALCVDIGVLHLYCVSLTFNRTV